MDTFLHYLLFAAETVFNWGVGFICFLTLIMTCLLIWDWRKVWVKYAGIGSVAVLFIVGLWYGVGLLGPSIRQALA